MTSGAARLLVFAGTATLALGVAAPVAGAGGPEHPPNGYIRKAGGAFEGGHHITDDASVQQVTKKVRPGETARFEVVVENLNEEAKVYSLLGEGSKGKFVVAYRFEGTDVTAEVVTGAFTFPELDQYELSEPVKVRIKAKKAAAPGKVFPREITAFHSASPYTLDDHLTARVRVV